MSCGIKRILQFKNAMSPGPLAVYDGSGEDITNSSQYSWSVDGVCWTNWVKYSQYLHMLQGVKDELYIRVLLFGSFGKISIHNVFTNCYSISLDCSDPFLESFCDNENLFDPYANLDCALLLQQQLSDSIICMLGIPIYYFKVKPDAKTADYTFKEYVLHNVESVKQIQLMIPDGAMPSSNPKFTALDFDWQTDWDVEIGKTQFATAFGDTAFPKVRDFIYIPMMKRMWSVNAAYDEKSEGLLWRSTTWKLTLVKYEDATNISTTDFDSIIDSWLPNNYEDVFLNKEKKEQERLTGTIQTEQPSKVENNLYNVVASDSIRKQYSKPGVSVLNNQINHRSNIVARNCYVFDKLDDKIIYQKGYCGHSGTLSFIINLKDSIDSEKSIIEFGPIKICIDDSNALSFNTLNTKLDPGSTYLVIIRWNKNNYTTSMDVYKYTYRENVASYALRPEMCLFDENPVYSGSDSYNQDFETCQKESGIISGYPCALTNIKLYNRDLGLDESIKESIKYTTTHSACVINDLARPFTDGYGYNVK